MEASSPTETVFTDLDISLIQENLIAVDVQALPTKTQACAPQHERHSTGPLKCHMPRGETWTAEACGFPTQLLNEPISAVLKFVQKQTASQRQQDILRMSKHSFPISVGHSPGLLAYRTYLILSELIPDLHRSMVWIPLMGNGEVAGPEKSTYPMFGRIFNIELLPDGVVVHIGYEFNRENRLVSATIPSGDLAQLNAQGIFFIETFELSGKVIPIGDLFDVPYELECFRNERAQALRDIELNAPVGGVIGIGNDGGEDSDSIERGGILSWMHKAWRGLQDVEHPSVMLDDFMADDLDLVDG